MVDKSIIKRINDETDLVELVGKYCTLTKQGSDYVCLCPFHNDSSPSLHVSPSKKVWSCWVCGDGYKGQGPISFVQKIENLSFMEAVIKLAKPLNISIDNRIDRKQQRFNHLNSIMEDACKFYEFYLKQTTEGDEGLEYLHNRSINDDIIKTFRIGLAPSLPSSLYDYLIKKGYLELDLVQLGLVSTEGGKPHDIFRNRIMFPLTNAQGKIVGFSGRIYKKADIEVGKYSKYSNSKETEIFSKNAILYNYFNAIQAIRSENKVYICEGFMDVIAMYKAGIYNCVGAMGTAFTEKHAEMLLGLTNNIVLCFDGDEAGIKAMKSATLALSKKDVIPNSLIIPDNQDPDEYAIKYGNNKLKELLETKSSPVYNWMYELAKEKYVPGDFKSAEIFKTEAFGYFKLFHQATLVEQLLKKLATDLDIDLETVKQDFGKTASYVDETVNENKPHIIETRVRVEPQSRITKPKNIKAIKMAYEMIIKYAIDNPGTAQKYFDLAGEFYLGNDFAYESSILLLIKVIDESYKNDSNKDIILTHLEKQKAYIDYYNSVKDSPNIASNIRVVEECCLCIKRYYNKLETLISANKVRLGDDTAYKDFISRKSIK